MQLNAKYAKAQLRRIGRTREWLAPEVGLKPSSLNNVFAGRPTKSTVIKLIAVKLECDEQKLIAVSR